MIADILLIPVGGSVIRLRGVPYRVEAEIPVQVVRSKWFGDRKHAGQSWARFTLGPGIPGIIGTFRRGRQGYLLATMGSDTRGPIDCGPVECVEIDQDRGTVVLLAVGPCRVETTPWHLVGDDPAVPWADGPPRELMGREVVGAGIRALEAANRPMGPPDGLDG